MVQHLEICEVGCIISADKEQSPVILWVDAKKHLPKFSILLWWKQTNKHHVLGLGISVLWPD